jgi:hypothetical protein
VSRDTQRELALLNLPRWNRELALLNLPLLSRETQRDLGTLMSIFIKEIVVHFARR